MLVTYPDARANKYICGAIATVPPLLCHCASTPAHQQHCNAAASDDT